MMEVVRSQRQAAIQRNGIAIPQHAIDSPVSSSRLLSTVAQRDKTSSFASVVVEGDDNSDAESSFDEMSFLVSVDRSPPKC